jgi:hypothetical protein
MDENAAPPAPQGHAPSDSPVTFATVLEEELQQIAAARKLRGVAAENTQASLIGLAFSGGGIRSATFNLGFLQAMARKGLLHKFDYLSTVSGGGYIGAWLAALTRRFLESVPGSSFLDVERALVPGGGLFGRSGEPAYLRWLRLYSNYLTPYTGFLSLDTWATIVTWLRNVFLNQMVLWLFFMGVFMSSLGMLVGLLHFSRLHAVDLLVLGGTILFAGAVSMAVNVAEQIPSSEMLRTPFQRVKVTATVALPLCLACLLLNLGLWRSENLANSRMWPWFASAGAFYLLAWTLASVLLRRDRREPKSREYQRPSVSVFLSSSFLAGAAGGGLGRGYCSLLKVVRSAAYPRSVDWSVAIFGTGVVMSIVLLVGALQLGLAGRGLSDSMREFWTRLGGYLMLLALAWMSLAGALVFGPLLVLWILFKFHAWIIGLIALCLLFMLTVFYAARSGRTDKESVAPALVRFERFWTDLQNLDGDPKTILFVKIPQRLLSLFSAREFLGVVARVGPYVYAIAMFLLLATAVQMVSGLAFDPVRTALLWRLSNAWIWSLYVSLSPAFSPTPIYAIANWSAMSQLYWTIQWYGAPVPLASVGMVLTIISYLLFWRIGTNEFSLRHLLYVRLVRYFLAASNPSRAPQPFTGFDQTDDLPLNALAGIYPGPYPIFNAALNTISGEELGYTTRQAESFVFTPLYCGYDSRFLGTGDNRFKFEGSYFPSFSPTALGRAGGGLTQTGSTGGISLGLAMAISGAEPNRNLGYHPSTVTSAFLGLFDARANWRIGNPRFSRNWLRAAPAAGIDYLLSELFPNPREGYVSVSDGAHFESLGTYELIKRHCRLIVSCDAELDSEYEFDDLVALVEKVRTDFGVRIVIDFDSIRPKEGSSEHTFVIGDIYYDPLDSADRGKLVYVKASMPERNSLAAPNGNSLPDDVWRYYEKHKTFPHQSTADQWFDEVQFESYRALGEFVGLTAAEEIQKQIGAALS